MFLIIQHGSTRGLEFYGVSFFTGVLAMAFGKERVRVKVKANGEATYSTQRKERRAVGSFTYACLFFTPSAIELNHGFLQLVIGLMLLQRIGIAVVSSS